MIGKSTLIVISSVCVIIFSYGIYTNNLLYTSGSYLLFISIIILYGLSHNGIQISYNRGKITFREKGVVDNSVSGNIARISEVKNLELNVPMTSVMEAPSNIKYTIKKFLELIRGIFDADACYLYLLATEMDSDEKKEILDERIKEMRDAYEYEREKAKNLSNEKDPFKDEEGLILPRDLGEPKEKDVEILKFIDVSQKKKEDGTYYWDYEYRNRPREYVIFKKGKNEDDISENNVIFNEGLTAYTFRTHRLLINSKKKVPKHRASASLNSKHRIKPSSAMSIGFPLLYRGKAIGVITIEFYDQTRSYDINLEDKNIREVSSYLPLLVRLIYELEPQFSEGSYQALFGRINLLEALKRLEKKIEPSGSNNKKIYRDTKHLFFVFKDREYIGYEEILDRVIEYANDINEYLENEYLERAEGYNSFKKFLNQVRKHEELLFYGLNDFRDLFMHQFHVFVSGYIIINELGIDLFQSEIQKHMRYALGPKKQNLVISEDDVLRIWFLTAFYHDYAYIFEKIDKELPVFYNDVLGDSFKVKSNWEQLLRKESDFTIYLSYLIKFFSSPKGTNSDVLLKNYLDAIIESHDHGVLSALLLIHNYNSKVTQKIYNECLYAAFSISIHTKKVYENLMEGDMRRISFESFPIAFLLSFCDTAQSFDRIAKRQDYHVRFSDIKFSDNRIIYELEYLDEKGKKIPSPETIEGWAKQAHNIFKSSKFFFEIKYCEVKDQNKHYDNSKKHIYTLSYGYYKDTPNSEIKSQDDQINYT